jgi:hypothetical protein
MASSNLRHAIQPLACSRLDPTSSHSGEIRDTGYGTGTENHELETDRAQLCQDFCHIDISDSVRRDIDRLPAHPLDGDRLFHPHLFVIRHIHAPFEMKKGEIVIDDPAPYTY